MADKKFEPKPHAYPRTKAPRKNVPARQVEISVGKTERLLAPPNPDAPGMDLTGRYERDDAQATLQVNQAGRGMVCWLVDYKTKALTKLEGIQLGGQLFSLNREFGDTEVARLSPLFPNALIFDQAGSKSLFKKVGNGPTLSDFALLMLPTAQRAIATRQEHFPLTTEDKRRIRAALQDTVLSPLIEAWLNAPNDPDVATRLKRGQLAEVIDDHVGKLFAGINADDHPLAEELAQQLLMAQTLTHDGDTRSLLDWLQNITTRSEQERLGPVGEMNHLIQHLKLSPRGTGQHFYALTLSVIGPSGDFGVGLGGFIGSLEVSETNEAGDQVLRNIGTFSLVLGQVGLGPSVGVSIGFSTTGSGQSPYVWQASNFPGTFTMIDLGAGVSSPVPIPPDKLRTAGSVASAMFLRGNGELPEMIVDFAGFSQQFGIGAGGAISGAVGYIFSAPSAPSARPGFHKVEQNYTTAHRAETQVHFKLGSALLTDEARQLLRLLCANELVAFTSPGSQLTINSHADRVDSDTRNLELSDLRAKNTRQALQDIIGDTFVPNARVLLRGLGEQGAKEAGDKDHTPNPVRRKSEVVVNSRLVVTLFGRE